MKKGMKAKEKNPEGRGLRTVESIISDEMRERDQIIYSRTTMLRVFSRWGLYWKCILYKYFANIARLCTVTMAGAGSCSELSNSRMKAWEASFSPLKAANLKWSSCSQWNLWLWGWFVSVEFHTRSCLCFEIISWDQRKTSVLLLWVMSCCLVFSSVLQLPVFMVPLTESA